MKTKYQIITLRSLESLGAVALITAAVVAAGCKSSPDRTSGQRISDRQIARSVNKALSNDPTFKYTNVKPNVYGGTVQLCGLVETPEQRLRAAELAARTKGTKQVINQIMLKPVSFGPVAIRDPLGNDLARLMVDTNVPLPQLRNLPAQATPEPTVQPAKETTLQPIIQPSKEAPQPTVQPAKEVPPAPTAQPVKEGTEENSPK